LRPPYNQDRIEDEPADATYSDHYDTVTRHETLPERGPLQSYMVW